METCEELEELACVYNPRNCTTLENTGSSWKVSVSSDGSCNDQSSALTGNIYWCTYVTALTGGPLGDDIYQLAQVTSHIKWKKPKSWAPAHHCTFFCSSTATGAGRTVEGVNTPWTERWLHANM